MSLHEHNITYSLKIDIDKTIFDTIKMYRDNETYRIKDWISKMKICRHLPVFYYILIMVGLIVLLPICGTMVIVLLTAKIFINSFILISYKFFKDIVLIVLIIDSISPTCLLLFFVWSGYKCDYILITLILTINIIEEITIILITIYIFLDFQQDPSF